MDMNCLYDSDLFIVVHMANTDGEGFEIVNKKTERTTYLTGDAGEAFKFQIREWQQEAPSEDDVDETLTRFSILNSNPLVMH